MSLAVEKIFIKLTRKVIIASFLVLTLVSLLLLSKDWLNQRNQHSKELSVVLEKVMRSLEGELFLGKTESILLLKNYNTRTHSLENIVISQEKKCGPSAAAESHSQCATTQFPTNKTNYSVTVVKPFVYSLSSSFGYFLFGSLLGLALLSFLFYNSFFNTLKSSIITPLIRLGNNIEEEIAEPEVSREIQLLSFKIKEFIAQRDKFHEKEASYELATQIAHDIRSPVAALKILQRSINISDPLKDLIDSSIARIQKISDDLLKKNIEFTKTSTSTLLSVIDEVLEEKRLLFTHKDVSLIKSCDPIQGELNLDLAGITRVLSNVLQNSYEAVEDRGKVYLTFEKTDSSVRIIIEDDGGGFSSQLLDQIGISKVTLNKNNGNGLGLFNAKRTILAHNGIMKISNTEIGARVEIQIPCLFNFIHSLEDST